MCTHRLAGDVIVQREGAQSLERWPPPVDTNDTLDQTLQCPCENCGSARKHEANRSIILRAGEVSRRPQHRDTEGLQCLKEHNSLGGDVQKTVVVQPVERLGKLKQTLKTSLESRNFVFNK